MYSSKILIVENFLLSARFNGRFIAATAFGLRLASLAAVRFASAAKAAAKRQRPSAAGSLRSLLSVLPSQATASPPSRAKAPYGKNATLHPLYF
jgi:hypothetical protein